MASLATLMARLLLCSIFLFSAYGKITGWEQTIGYMESRGMPLAQVGLPVAVAAEILGGLALLLGLKARWGAVVLILFLLPATFYFHNFWTYPEEQVRNQMIHFMKNLTLMGGLLMVVAYGAGGVSLDAAFRKKKEKFRR